MGEWIQNEGGAMEYIRGGFAKLFTSSLTYSLLSPPHLSRWQAALSEDESLSLSLSTPVTNEEIKQDLWSFKAFKASGLDGLHAGFFQRFWMIVGDSIRKEVE